MNFLSDTRVGTLGGTLLIVFLNIRGEEIIKTAVLAAIGAMVSYLVSLSLQYLVKRFRK